MEAFQKYLIDMVWTKNILLFNADLQLPFSCGLWRVHGPTRTSCSDYAIIMLYFIIFLGTIHRFIYSINNRAEVKYVFTNTPSKIFFKNKYGLLKSFKYKYEYIRVGSSTFFFSTWVKYKYFWNNQVQVLKVLDPIK